MCIFVVYKNDFTFDDERVGALFCVRYTKKMSSSDYM